MTIGLFEFPSSDKIESLRREAGSCQACPLWKDATQTVFGEGPANAEMFVGEQPGDREDRKVIRSSGQQGNAGQSNGGGGRGSQTRLRDQRS
jgi:uracil-DNA glycosylase